MKTALVIGGEFYGRVPPNVPDGYNGAAKAAAVNQQRFLQRALTEQAALHGITRIIHTGIGAGSLAWQWANKAGVEHVHVRIDKRLPQYEAMRRRNAALIDMRPDLVIAFNGGRATKDAIKRAVAAGIEVLNLMGCK